MNEMLLFTDHGVVLREFKDGGSIDRVATDKDVSRLLFEAYARGGEYGREVSA